MSDLSIDNATHPLRVRLWDELNELPPPTVSDRRMSAVSRVERIVEQIISAARSDEAESAFSRRSMIPRSAPNSTGCDERRSPDLYQCIVHAIIALIQERIDSGEIRIPHALENER